MNKKVFLLLLMLPICIYAKSCDEEKRADYTLLAENITYDNTYNKENGTFTIVLYNVMDGMYAKLDSTTYEPNSENIVTINGIKQGTYAFINIFGPDDCGTLNIVTIREQYFNPYYGTDKCAGYENKIVACSSQYTDAKVTDTLLELAKENYDNAIDNNREKIEEETDDSILSKIKEIFLNWGIKVLLVVVTIFVTSTIFGVKFRKIKHGI